MMRNNMSVDVTFICKILKSFLKTFILVPCSEITIIQDKLARITVVVAS